MNRAEQAALAYCSVLFADLADRLDDGYELTILTMPDRRVRWLRGDEFTPAAIAKAICEADARPGAGAVYISMCPARPGTPHTTEDGKTRRARVADVGALAFLWVDLDIAGPGHESGKRLPPDRAAIRRILDACGLPESALVNTGGGVHAYWLLDEPIVFADEPDAPAAHAAAAALVRNWQLTLAMHADRLGKWAVDPTHDLARVLRAPGSVNRKTTPHVGVEMIESHPERRYAVDDVLAHVAEQDYLDRFALGDASVKSELSAGDLQVIWRMVHRPEYRDRGYLPGWLDGAIKERVFTESDPLVKILRNGHRSGDDSSTDASLARRCADLGLDQRDAAEAIMCRRLRSGAKLDKVDPHRRVDYVQTTVAKMFGESAKAQARSAEITEATKAALAAQDADAGRPPRPAADPVAAAAAATGGARGLGGAVLAGLDAAAAVVRPDPEGADPIVVPPVPADAPSAGPDGEIELDGSPVAEPDPAPAAAPDGDTPDGDTPEDPDPVADPSSTGGGRDTPPDATPAGSAPAPVDAPQDVPLPPEPDLPDDPGPAAPAAPAAPETGDQPAAERAQRDPADERPDEGFVPPVGPGVEAPRTGEGLWGSRTRSQHQLLETLTRTLLGDELAARVRIWRCFTRGRGAKAERYVQMRIDPDYRWPGVPPSGYTPGLPLNTGMYPAGAFDGLKGWVKALRQDCMLVTRPMSPDEFTQRFGDTLVRVWEPDDSGGSLANVTHDAMRSYLTDFPPVTSWDDAVEQGMPLLVQDEPRWSVGTPFTCLVRWGDFTRHVRNTYALNITPAMAAEMAQLAGAVRARTQAQDGRWWSIRPEYLSRDDWRRILHGGQVAEQQREERHGMRVMPGGRAGEPGADPGVAPTRRAR